MPGRTLMLVPLAAISSVPPLSIDIRPTYPTWPSAQRERLSGGMALEVWRNLTAAHSYSPEAICRSTSSAAVSSSSGDTSRTVCGISNRGAVCRGTAGFGGCFLRVSLPRYSAWILQAAFF